MEPLFFRIISIGRSKRIRPRLRVRARGRRRSKVISQDYQARKEAARAFVLERLDYFKKRYIDIDTVHDTAMQWKKLAIRNQRSRWGSCSASKNLNFNYRILDLPAELQDYVIVHELCHLKELNHGSAFWHLMKQVIPNARELNVRARRMKISHIAPAYFRNAVQSNL